MEPAKRFDAWSDLDVFVIAPRERLGAFLNDTGWLEAGRPLAFAYRNTIDGWRALYDDGVFVECAAFDPDRLANIPFAPGRIIWAADGFDPRLAQPAAERASAERSRDRAWLAGELLSALYVGAGRFARGERLAAMRAVQVEAVDRMIDLIDLRDGGGGDVDPFNAVRRVEARSPLPIEAWSRACPGVERTPDAAAFLLDWLAGEGLASAAAIGLVRRRIEAAHTKG